MASGVPKVLILGHSFVKRLSRDISRGIDPRMDLNFGLEGDVSIRLSGVGGRTVEKLRRFDLSNISSFAPDILILEVGTNDLAHLAPEVVGSAIDDLVHLILDSFSVSVLGWCCVIPRGISHDDAALFHHRARVLNNYLRVVLDSIPNVFCWEHRVFNHPAKNFYVPDAVHLNFAGQYQLYRSYRGAVLKALSLLKCFSGHGHV